ncbi:MAG: motility associated factor glycosyltransferase family protein [Tissierellia bacterium]|nr:motility associated factor glycosyltransferase family protein [Tissierellia bacterium]
MFFDENIKLLKKNYLNIYKDMININPNQDIYEVVKTKTDQYTLKINQDKKTSFLHSKYNPYREAVNIAEENYHKSVSNYIVFGLGFGYHVEQLIVKAPNADFYIIETNKEVFRLALENVDLKNIINNDRVHLCVSDDITEISEILSSTFLLNDIKIVLHNASMKIMPNNLIDIKYLLEEYIMKESSYKKLATQLRENFNSNIVNYDENVDVLFNKYNNIPLYIVSAGPSLDRNIKDLKKAKRRGIILSVGRAVKPLLKENIKPDLIIITDPSPYLYVNQLKGLDLEVPIIVLSTCDKNVMLKYMGRRLIALQRGYPEAEKYAKEHNHKLVQTGGSVATTALDVAINMGCNPIIFVGQDLAYTENRTHSEGAYSRDIALHNNLREIEDVYGNIVYTPRNLYSYLRWIQNRIKREKDITFIDATEGGAKIIGTKILTLKETIEKYSNRNIEFNICCDYLF